MPKSPLQRKLKAFYQYLVVDCGHHRTTAQSYCRTLRPVLVRLRTLNPSHQAIRRTMLAMHHAGYSYSHVLNTTLALEHFSAMGGRPITLGRARKPKRVLPQTLTEAEVARIIDVAPDLRQRALLAALAFSGIRNSELCNLRVADLDAATSRLKIVGGKNNKDRFVNISPECSRLLLTYLASYSRPADGLLFTTVRRNAPLTTADVRKILRTNVARANIQRRVYPHLLRHSLATNLLNRGASLITIRDQLGHTFIESTMVYAHPSQVRTRAEYDFYKPAYL